MNKKKKRFGQIRLVLAIFGGVCCGLIVPFAISESGTYSLSAGLISAVVGFCGIWIFAGLLYKIFSLQYYYTQRNLEIMRNVGSCDDEPKDEQKQ